MGKKVPTKKEKEVISCVAQGNSYRYCSRKYSVSVGKISELVNTDQEYMNKCELETKKIEEQVFNDLKEVLEGKSVINTINKIIGMVNNEKSMKVLQAKPDLAMRVYGIMADKGLKAQEVKLKEKALKQEKELALMPTILNDAPKEQ